MVGVDINTLTMEQYLALSQENQAPGVVKPEIIGNVNFEIKSQFMQELKEDTFFGIKNKDAYDHVDRVLNIGPIHGMTPTQALMPIQTMVGQSQKWHDGTSSRNISSSSDTDGLAAVISKLDNLGCNIKKLKENAHAIQVRCQICEGPHLDKECPLNKEVKQVDEGKYDEFRCPAPFIGRAVERQAEHDEWLKTQRKAKLIMTKSSKISNLRTKMPMVVPISTREPKRIVNQSVATPLRRIVASESTNQKPRHTTKKLYASVSKTCLVKFENDQIAPILGYGDLVQGTVTIKSVYYIEGLNHNLFSVGQFCDADLEVAFRKSTCYIRDLKGNDQLTGSRGTDLYSITLKDTSSPNPICLMAKATSTLCSVRIVRTDQGMEFLNKTLHAYFASERIQHLMSVARTPEQNDIVERRNCTLVEAARTMLSAANFPLFFWAEAITTACFTQNRSLVVPRHEKTPYHIINDRKISVKFVYIFCSLCYIIRDGENLDKMKGKGDAWIFVGYSTQSRAYRVFNRRTRVIVETIHVNFDELRQMASDHVSSNPVPQCPKRALEHDSLSPGHQSQENVPQAARTVTTSNELDLLFSLMFDELLNGSTQVVSKSSTVTTDDAPNKCQQQHTTPLNTQTTPKPTCQVLTQAQIVTSTENINQTETITENAQGEDDEFINIFCTPV
nr:hypothetical protein [Tanacetum cinerariifolium]